MDKKTLIASTAAALFALGAAGTASAEHHEGEAETAKIKCDGGNACKGQGECHAAGHDCSGQNGCKGQGFLSMTKADCETAGGKVES